MGGGGGGGVGGAKRPGERRIRRCIESFVASVQYLRDCS